MVDTIDLFLSEPAMDMLIEFDRGIEVPPERFLYDQPRPSFRIVQSCLADILDDRWKDVGRQREIEDPVPRNAVLLLQSGELFSEAPDFLTATAISAGSELSPSSSIRSRKR